MKTCTKCRIDKEKSEFYTDKRHSDGLESQCKECRKKCRQSDKGKEILIRVQGKRRKKYPEKYKAYNSVSNAIRDGKLIRKPCEICGEDRSDAHHEDYSKPYDVVWLCKKHHTKLHRKDIK